MQIHFWSCTPLAAEASHSSSLSPDFFAPLLRIFLSVFVSAFLSVSVLSLAFELSHALSVCLHLCVCSSTDRHLSRVFTGGSPCTSYGEWSVCTAFLSSLSRISLLRRLIGLCCWLEFSYTDDISASPHLSSFPFSFFLSFAFLRSSSVPVCSSALCHESTDNTLSIAIHAACFWRSALGRKETRKPRVRRA